MITTKQIILPAPTISYYEVRYKNIFYPHTDFYQRIQSLSRTPRKMVADKIIVIDKGEKQFYIA